MGRNMSTPLVFEISRWRPLAIAAGVVLLHVGALWALQSGLLARMVEVVTPVEVIAEFVQPPRPKAETPPPVPPAKQPVAAAQAVPQKAAALPPAPMPVAIADAAPAPHAPTGVVASTTPTPPMVAPQAATPAAVAVAPPAPRVELPSSDADYLHNPKPVFPPMSKRLGEQGLVMVRAWIGVDGVAQRAEISQSSGFDRLDQAALATARGWRYVPGKRAGVPEAMWATIPIKFNYSE